MSDTHLQRYARRPAVRRITAVSCIMFGLCLQAGCNTALQESDQNLVGNQAGDSNLTPAGFSGIPAAAPSEDSGGDVARDIEEADLVKIVGDRLYALNPYKGLLIVDVADPAAPALLGSLDLRGRGVEMYVVGERAYVLLSAEYYYGYPAIAVDDRFAPAELIQPRVPEYEGSQLAVVDISDPVGPASLGKINLVGYANDSRRVGDVIYVIGSDWNQGADPGFVASINVADPANPQAVERKAITASGDSMHVSSDAIYAASSRYDSEANQSVTRIQVVDISDPAGAIILRDTIEAPGTIRNRFYMDAFGDAFRIVTQSNGFGFQQVRLFTFDIADRDDVQPLGDVLIIENESLEAVRFDGVRGYAVTFLRIDPLFVLDLSDPASPKVTGELEVPGFSTHIEPRGDRLIAVGIDDTDGNRPAVAYYDVADPSAPAQLGRVILGPPGSYTSSDAVYDEKAFKVIDELGLIVVPFHHFEYAHTFPPGPGPEPVFDGGDDIAVSSPAATAADIAPDPACTNGVQLVDFSDTALTQRGMFESMGYATRVGAVGDHVFALSAAGLQTIDISDRDNPAQAGVAQFLNDAEMDHLNGCFGYPGGFPVDFVGIEPVDDAFDIAALMSALGTCGAIPGVALLMFPVGMYLMRQRSRAVRRL